MPAVQSKPVSAGGVAPWLGSHPAAKSTLLSLLLLLIFARKRLAATLKQKGGAARVNRGHVLNEGEMDHALEQVYVPSKTPGDESYDLLVPHRGRISQVKVRPTKQSTFNAHYRDFKRLPPVAAATAVSKKKAENKEVTEEDKKLAKREQAKAVRAEGGAAAASAKKVGVNKEFMRQLKAIFRILVPRSNAKEVFIFCLHTSFLILRTYLR